MSNVVNFKALHEFAPTANYDAPAVAKSAPTAFELYPDDAELLNSLRLCGVERIHGIFDAEAWAGACVAARLYRLPLHGRIRADMTRIKHEAHEIAMNADDRAWHFGDPRPAIGRRLMGEYAKSGRLPGILWPRLEENFGPHDEWVKADFPPPPAAMLPDFQRAQLAGLEVGAAVPGEAITVKSCANQSSEYAAVAAVIDPIIYGVHRATNRVAVLGFYGQSENDSAELKSLVAVLETLTIELCKRSAWERF
jgi:hypothetical protein